MRYILRFAAGPLALLAILAIATSAFAQSEIEFKVKAAFLFNFAKFTEWPSAKMGSATPFVIGCFSDREFMEVLEATVAGKTVESRRIAVKRVSGPDDLRECHMLFIGRTKDENATALLARAKEMHILTVGEREGFADRGGMIEFVRVEGSVRFAITPEVVKGAGLKLSSKLLGLALSGNDRPGGGDR